MMHCFHLINTRLTCISYCFTQAMHRLRPMLFLSLLAAMSHWSCFSQLIETGKIFLHLNANMAVILLITCVALKLSYPRRMRKVLQNDSDPNSPFWIGIFSGAPASFPSLGWLERWWGWGGCRGHKMLSSARGQNTQCPLTCKSLIRADKELPGDRDNCLCCHSITLALPMCETGQHTTLKCNGTYRQKCQQSFHHHSRQH